MLLYYCAISKYLIAIVKYNISFLFLTSFNIQTIVLRYFLSKVLHIPVHMLVCASGVVFLILLTLLWFSFFLSTWIGGYSVQNVYFHNDELLYTTAVYEHMNDTFFTKIFFEYFFLILYKGRWVSYIMNLLKMTASTTPYHIFVTCKNCLYYVFIATCKMALQYNIAHFKQLKAFHHDLFWCQLLNESPDEQYFDQSEAIWNCSFCFCYLSMNVSKQTSNDA